jgi:hypothetical protein
MNIERIVHLADVHIRRGPHRYDTYAATFDALFESVDRECPCGGGRTLFVLAGDILHDRSALDAFCVQLFCKLMRGLAQRGEVVVVQGNHDHHPSHGDPECPHDALAALVAILGLPGVRYVSESSYFALDDGVGVGVVTVHDVTEPGDARAGALVSELPPFPKPVQNTAGTRVNLAVFHGALTGVTTDPNAHQHARSRGVPVDWFEGYDGALLGDVHLQQIGNHVVDTLTSGESVMRFGKAPSPATWAYPGSLIQQDHGEQLWGHGYWLWDLPERSVRPVHVRCPEGFVTLRAGELMYDGSWLPIARHLKDPDFPRRVRARVTGPEADAALTDLSASGVAILSVSGGARVQDAAAERVPERVSELVPASGDPAPRAPCVPPVDNDDEVIAAACLPVFRDARLRAVAQERSVKIDKLLSRYRDVREKGAARLSIGTLRWSWILSFPGDNETTVFSEAGITVVHAANGAGKTALLETLFISLYGEGFPSRSSREESGSFINDRKPADAVASTEVLFHLGDATYRVVRKWQRAGERAVCKEASLSCCSGSKVGALCKGRTDVDRWVSENVCPPGDFLAGVMLTQASDGDFLSLSPKDQCGLINRAYGMDRMDAMHDLLSEAKNALTHVINHVPAAAYAESGSLEEASSAHAAAAAEDAGARAELETLPSKRPAPPTSEVEAARQWLQSHTVDVEGVPCVDFADESRWPASTSDTQPVDVSDALKACEAAARYSRECASTTLSHADLTATRAGDADTACGADDVCALRASATVARADARVAGTEHGRLTAAYQQLEAETVDLEGAARKASALEASSAADRYAHTASDVAERWDAAPRTERPRLLMRLLMCGAPSDLLGVPKQAFSVKSRDDPRWALGFRSCLEAFGGAVPPPRDCVGTDPLRAGAASELEALAAESRGRLAASAPALAERAIHLAVLTAAVQPAEDAAERAAQRASDWEARRVRTVTLSRLENALADVPAFDLRASKRMVVAAWDRQARTESAVRTVRDDEAETRRAVLKARIASADLEAAAKRLGVAEAVDRLACDSNAIAECQRRVGVLAHALSVVAERKRTVYTDVALPDLCERATRIVQRVDPTLAVTADPSGDGQTVRWSAVVGGREVRIRRASGFQRFMIALGLRIALGSMIRRSDTLIVDEGFTACDAHHTSVVPRFLESLLGPTAFRGILLVTHIEALQDGRAATMSLRLGERVTA